MGQSVKGYWYGFKFYTEMLLKPAFVELWYGIKGDSK